MTCALTFLSGGAAEADSGLTNGVLRVLPLGAVRHEGHLCERLELQAKGLTGHAEELKSVPLEKEGCWARARGVDEIDAINMFPREIN